MVASHLALRTRPGWCRRPARRRRAAARRPSRDRLIEPRVGWKRTPRSRAAAISADSRSPAPCGVDVEVVGRGRAARQRQLGQPHPRRHVGRLLVEAPPQRVERGEPAEQRGRRHRRVGPGEVLVQVVMGVDQARRDQATVGVDRPAGGRRARPVPSPTAVTNPPSTATQPPGCSWRSSSMVTTSPAWATTRSTGAGASAHALASESMISCTSAVVVRGLTKQKRSTVSPAPRRRHHEGEPVGQGPVAPGVVVGRRPADAAEDARPTAPARSAARRGRARSISARRLAGQRQRRLDRGGGRRRCRGWPARTRTAGPGPGG